MTIRVGQLAALAAGVLMLFVAGCSSTNDAGLLGPPTSSLAGTWQYQVTNAYDSAFVDCTGDAVALEGLSFADGMAAAPICVVSNTFDVTQSGDLLVVAPHDVSCSDGSVASVSASVTLVQDSLSGAWSSASDEGVDAAQSFSASVAGETLAFTEDHRSFGGSFSGACDLVPPLHATGRIL